MQQANLWLFLMKSSESHDCISENLTLPDEIGGEKITWASSDTSVLKNDGTVIRYEGEEKNVTLTATAGGKTAPRYFVNGIKPEGEFSVSADVYMDFEEGSTAMYDFEFDFGTDKNAGMRFYFYPDGTVGEVRYYGGATS